MRRSAAPQFRSLALAALVALPLALMGACTGETGVTPSCVPDVDANGIKTGVDKGCTGFAVCAANPAKPEVCCEVPDGGAPMSESDHALCLFAYGAGPAPTTAATSTGTGTGTSSGTSSGTGTSSGSGSGGAGGGK
jgi:uncharacterized membrane protein YgcG